MYDAYAQSWVFDSENAGSSNGATPANNSTYVKITQNGTPKNPLGRPNGLQNGSTVKEGKIRISSEKFPKKQVSQHQNTYAY